MHLFLSAIVERKRCAMCERRRHSRGWRSDALAGCGVSCKAIWNKMQCNPHADCLIRLFRSFASAHRMLSTWTWAAIISSISHVRKINKLYFCICIFNEIISGATSAAADMCISVRQKGSRMRVTVRDAPAPTANVIYINFAECKRAPRTMIFCLHSFGHNSKQHSVDSTQKCSPCQLFRCLHPQKRAHAKKRERVREGERLNENLYSSRLVLLTLQSFRTNELGDKMPPENFYLCLPFIAWYYYYFN